MPKNCLLLIHGGAGELDEVHDQSAIEQCLLSLRTILQCGQKILRQGGRALDAVETCAALLEDDPLFNAGRGSVLNERGEVRMDAAIMDGRTCAAGAAADIYGIAHPVKLARLILEHSPHVMLAGAGALLFARRHKLGLVPGDYHVTGQRRAEYRALRARRPRSKQVPADKRHGTIGAVARDRYGNLAAATSTGGMACKQAGRIGDSPIVGAGVYADNQTCAVSATGHGEMFMRTVLAKHVADLIALRKLDAATAARLALNHLHRKVKGRGGLIIIDHKGRYGVRYNTRTMAHGWIDHNGEIHCAC